MRARGLLLLTSLVWLCACDMVSISKDIKSQSDEIKDRTKHVEKRTDDLERELVNKESNTALKQNLDLLFGEGEFGRQDITDTALINYAAFAIEAMHFQYWKNDYSESLAVLDEFFRQPLEMMFVRVTGHIPRAPNSIEGVLDPDRDFKAIGSLAAFLDRQRDEYAQVLSSARMNGYSAYDVILQALKNRGKLERNEPLPRATRLVLQFKQEAIYVIQMRHNYLPVIVLSRITNIQEHGLFGRLFDLLTGMDARIAEADPEQFKQWSGWLQDALDTRQALADMCIKPEFNRSIFSILNGVKFPPVPKANALGNKFVELFQQVASQKYQSSATANCPR